MKPDLHLKATVPAHKKTVEHDGNQGYSYTEHYPDYYDHTDPFWMGSTLVEKTTTTKDTPYIIDKHPLRDAQPIHPFQPHDHFDLTEEAHKFATFTSDPAEDDFLLSTHDEKWYQIQHESALKHREK